MSLLKVCFFTIMLSESIPVLQSKVISQNSSLKKLREWCSVGWLKEKPCTYTSSADTSDHKACDSVLSSYRMICAWAPSITDDTVRLINLNTREGWKNNPTPSFMRSGAFTFCARCVCVCVCVCVAATPPDQCCHLLHRRVCDGAPLKEQHVESLLLKKNERKRV